MLLENILGISKMPVMLEYIGFFVDEEGFQSRISEEVKRFSSLKLSLRNLSV